MLSVTDSYMEVWQHIVYFRWCTNQTRTMYGCLNYFLYIDVLMMVQFHISYIKNLFRFFIYFEIQVAESMNEEPQLLIL